MAPASAPIAIIGAGLSGVTLGFCLKHKGIAAVIFERAPSAPRYNYGISLYPSTYRPLLNLLNMDETTFRQTLAVDSHYGGSGALLNPNSNKLSDAFQCHRGRLEKLLRDSLSISWSKSLSEVHLPAESSGVTARFDDGENVTAECLIACDGPHSAVRQSLGTSMKLQVLPYVVFNGKRRISPSEFEDKFKKHTRDSVSIQTHRGKIRLQISICECTAEQVDLSYTYSRPAKEGLDSIHKPDRPMSGARDIPNEFFEELAALGNLEPPFDDIFNVEKVRQDRLLHWLMRCVEPGLEDIEKLASQRVILIGDAVHATPILGGEGANMSIEDSVKLAEHISRNGLNSLKTFTESKFHEWRQSVEDSKSELKSMHSSTHSSL